VNEVNIKYSILAMLLSLNSFSVFAVRYGISHDDCDAECGSLLRTITFGQPILVIVYLLILIFGMIKLHSIYEQSDFANSTEPWDQFIIGCKYFIVIVGGLYLLSSL
jgi:hypothetical protein